MVCEPRHKRGSWVPHVNSVATACVVLLLVLLSAVIDVMAMGAQPTAKAVASDSDRHTFAQGVVDGATPSMNSAKALVGPYGFRHSRAVLVVDGNATLHCIRRCDGGASSPAVIPCVAWSFPTGLPVLHTSTADHDDEVDDGSEAVAFGHAQAAARRACHPLSAPPLVHGDGQLFFPTKARRCNAEARSGDSGTAVVHRIQEDATRDATSSDGFEEDATSFVRLGSLGDFLRKQLVVVNQTQFYTTSSFTTWLLDAESGQEVPRDVRLRRSGGLLPTFEVTRFDTILHASNAVAGFAWNLTTSKFRISPSGGTPWTTRQSPQQGESVHCQDRLNVECREEQNYWRQHDINSRTTTTPLARAMQISESAREAEWQALDEVLRLWDWVPEGTKQDAAVSLVVLRDDVIPVADAKQRWQQYHADKVKEILSREAATPTSMQRMVLTAPLEPSASSGSPSASPVAEDAHRPFGRVDHHHRAHTIDGSALEEFVVSEHLIKQQRGSAASSGIASLARGQQYLHSPNIRIATTRAVSGDGDIAPGDSLQRNHAQPIPHPSHRMDTHRGEAAPAAEGAAFIAHTHRPVQVSWNRSTVFLAAQAGLLVVAAVLAAIGIVPRRKMQHAWAETEMERTLAQRQVAMLRSAAASSVALLRDPTTVSPFSQQSGSAPSSLPPSMRLGPSVVGCVAVTPVHDMAPCSVENIGVATVASNSSRSSAVAPLDPGALVSPEHAEDGTERRRQSSLFADMPNVSFTSHTTAMAPTSSHSVAVDTRHMGGIPRPKPAPPSSMLPAFTEVPESPHSATPGITGDDGDVPAHAASLRNVSFAGDLGSTSGTGATQSSSDGMERTNSSFHDAATETDVSGEVGMSVRALSNTSNPQEEDPRNDDEEEEDPVSPLHDNAVMSPVACLPPTENGGASASQFGDLRNLSTGSRTEDEDDDQSWWRRGLAAARGRKPGAEPLTNLTAAATSFSAMDDDEGPQSPCTNTSADLHMTHCPSSMILTDGGGDDSAASPMVHSDGDVMREASPDMDTTRGRMSVDSAASAEARRLTAPQLFQLHFKVLRRIGIGGAGCVFCVEHRVTKAQYAIKVVALEEDDVRSIREAVLHGSFDCPYVVRFFYCWIEDMSVDTAVQLGIFDRDDGLDAMSAISRDSVVAKNGHGGASTAPSTTTEEPLRLLFIQMEYFKHGTLEDWLKRRQRDWLRVLAKSRLEMAARSATLPCGGDDPVTGVMERPPLNDIGAMEIDRVDCCEYILQICKGLEYLHEQGIVHRDVKPSNIFMTEKNGVKIGDFGLASRRAGANDDVTTLAETGIGEEDTTTGCSPLYCSPEQRAGKRVTFASDVFSVGVLAIELYSPFATAHERIATLDLLRATGRVPPDLLTAFPEEMALINHLLVLQPLQRPQMSAVIAKLKGVIKVLKASARKRGGLNGTPHDDLVSQPGSPERRAKPSEGVVGGAVPNGDMSLTTLPSAFGDQFHAGRTHLVDESDSDGSDSSSPTPIDRDVDGANVT